MCGATGIDERARIVLDVFADREYFDTLDGEGLEFPEGRRVHTLWFADDVVHIGRRRSHDGARVDVDLADDLADPGVSQRHAQLVLQPDGGCGLIDVGSTNGTTVNDSATPLVEGSIVRVRVGDHIHLGAWTTIVIRSVSVAPSAGSAGSRSDSSRQPERSDRDRARHRRRPTRNVSRMLSSTSSASFWPAQKSSTSRRRSSSGLAAPLADGPARARRTPPPCRRCRGGSC